MSETSTLQPLAADVNERIDRFLERSPANVEIASSLTDVSVDGLVAVFGMVDSTIWGFRSANINNIRIEANDGNSRFDAYRHWAAATLMETSTKLFTRPDRDRSQEEILQELRDRQQRLAELPMPLANLAVVSFDPLIRANKKALTTDLTGKGLSARRMRQNMRELAGYLQDLPAHTSVTTSVRGYTRLPDGQYAVISRSVTRATGQEPSSHYQINFGEAGPNNGHYSHQTGSEPRITVFPSYKRTAEEQAAAIQKVADSALAGKRLKKSTDFKPPKKKKVKVA